MMSMHGICMHHQAYLVRKVKFTARAQKAVGRESADRYCLAVCLDLFFCFVKAIEVRFPSWVLWVRERRFRLNDQEKCDASRVKHEPVSPVNISSMSMSRSSAFRTHEYNTFWYRFVDFANDQFPQQYIGPAHARIHRLKTWNEFFTHISENWKESEFLQ